MHDQPLTNSFDDPQSQRLQDVESSAPTTEVLIGRIVDGEATEADRERFEEFASANPSLWQALAHRQQDMMALWAQMDERTRFAEHIDLPLNMAPGAALRRPWLWAYSGWAALLVVGAYLAFQQFSQTPSVPTKGVDRVSIPSIDLTPEAHLREYLKAPFVLGEMPVTLTHIEELPDGRLAVSIVRRIEEIMFLDPDQVVDLDEHGNLKQDPAEIRRESERADGAASAPH